MIATGLDRIVDISQQGMGELSELLEPLYASLWNNNGFDDFLHVFTQTFQCNAASLISVHHEPKQARYGWIVGVPEQYVRWYIENNKVEEDPSIKLFEARSEEEPGFVTSSSVLQDTPLTAVVNDDFLPWLNDVGMVDTAGIVIPVADDHQIFLALQRDESVGQFDQTTVEKMNLLVPHIRQAVQLYIKFYQQSNDNLSLGAAINTLSRPTIVLNDFMEVSHINAKAEQLLAAIDELHVIDGKLVIADDEVYQQFSHQAWDMAHATDNLKSELTSTIVIKREENPITITLSPMFSQQQEAKSKGVLLQIFDPGSLALPKADRIQAIFKLTKNQGLISELLVRGLSLKEIAKERDISIHTVREQLRLIFKRTGYNRQSELIAAILRAVPE
jgi:DNA-binding CsgD family transcriptional regulator